MKGILAGLLTTARGQVLGRKCERIWTAFTQSGKVVIIEGDRVVKIVDPKRGQKGGHAQ